jgi:hypothetical protein
MYAALVTSMGTGLHSRPKGKGEAVRRLLVVAVALLISALMVASTVQAEPNAESQATPERYTAQHFNGKFPAAGWWKVGGTPQQRTIYRNANLWVVWNLAYVRPYTDVPLYWKAQVWYVAVGNRTVTLRCVTTDPSVAKEHIKRNGEYLGFVRAERSFCSQHPNFVKKLRPGKTFKRSYYLFHNVPWRRDRVSLELSPKIGRSTAFVNPWGRHLH